jgi:DMSO reductase anchor subunit
MHPAFSVIFLTTLIGVGQGLFLALATAQVYSIVNLVSVKQIAYFYGYSGFIALVFLIAGLIASMFHLGHPERAWRAVRQWRTSWLSREVIALPIFMFFVFLYATIHYMSWDFTLFKINEQINIDLSILIAVIGSMACFTLFFCTAMIYACIKFLQEWATVLTVVNFTVLGTASGFTLAALLAFFHAPELLNVFAGWAIVFTILGAITRIASLIRNRRIKPKSTPKSAIGIRHSKIKQTAQGAMGGSFNTREYFHGQTEDIVKHIKWSFLIMVFPVPLVLLTIGLIFDLSIAFILAAIVQYVGLIAERWFFFAQARHPQNIYYQAT